MRFNYIFMPRTEMNFFAFSTPLEDLENGTLLKNATFLTVIDGQRVYTEVPIDELRRLGYEFEISGYLRDCAPKTISAEVGSRRRGFLGLKKEYEVTAVYPACA